jgi:hypothetical protein
MDKTSALGVARSGMDASATGAEAGQDVVAGGGLEAVEEHP